MSAHPYVSVCVCWGVRTPRPEGIPLIRDTGTESKEFGKSENTLLSKVVVLKWSILLYIQIFPTPIISESLDLYDLAYIVKDD